MSAPTFEVKVLTPERAAFADRATHLLAPGVSGYLGILAHHAPLMTALKAGRLEVRTPDGIERVYHVDGGFLEVSENSVRVLADRLEQEEGRAKD
jgi:F-type H+-transporting ATPase subunit epsilon